MKKYIVGGAVRDELMNIIPNDVDYVVTGSCIQEMLDLGYKQVGKDFPVFLDNDNNEIALARKEIKTGNKHTDFSCVFDSDTTIEEDLERRDFTINSIAFDEETNTYIDPFNGIEDIKNRVLRIVSKEHFAEDPLRLLRVCRFMAQLEDFTLADETIEAMKDIVKSGDLKYLTKERVFKELEKALTQCCNSNKFFETLHKVGVLEVIFPILYNMTKVPERKEYHPFENTFMHTVICIRYSKNYSKLEKFALLVHDLGKTLTPADILPKHIGHDETGLQLIEEFCKTYKVPNNYKKFALLFCKVHMRIGRFLEMSLKKQYHLVKEISNNFKDDEQLLNIINCFESDYVAEFCYENTKDLYYKKLIDVVSTKKIMLNIFDNITDFKLSEKEQARLDKVKDTKMYPVVLDEIRINYLRSKLV